MRESERERRCREKQRVEVCFGVYTPNVVVLLQIFLVP